MNESPTYDNIEELEERLGDLYSTTSEEYDEFAWWLVKRAACAILIAGLFGLLVYLLINVYPARTAARAALMSGIHAASAFLGPSFTAG